MTQTVREFCLYWRFYSRSMRWITLFSTFISCH